MIGLENKDSSFFTIESPDISLTGVDFSKNLLSLSITERIRSMPQGTLSFYDPNHYYSRILRTGAQLNITWGYRNAEEIPDAVIANQINIDEVSGNIVRRGFQGFVSSPSGGGSNNGVVTYNCNFTAFGFRGTEQSKVYTSGTKRSVITQAFDDIGISSSKRLVEFSRANERVTPDKYIRQDETTFAFINRMAIEWGCVFYVAISQSSEYVGFFIEPNNMGSPPLPEWALNATGKSNVIGYQGEINNVKSYKWTSSESESGVGDNVNIDIVDGEIIFRRYAADQQRVVSYRLDQKKIQEVYKNVSDDGLSAQVALTKELLSVKDFEEIKHFFIPVEASTAPDGFGYRVNCEMIGNPLYIPGSLIKINNGFPDVIGMSQSKWYLNTVTHTINNSGYNMSIEVVDTFTLSPVGLVVL